MVRLNRRVLHVHWPDQLSRGNRAKMGLRVAHLGLGALMNFVAGGRLVVTVHNSRPHDPTAPAAHWSERVLLRIADSVVCLSAATYEHARKLTGGHASISQIPLMDFRGYYNSMSVAEAEQVMDLKRSERLTLVWFGIIRPYKGLGELARLLSDESDWDVEVLILGDSDAGEGSAEYLEVLDRDDRVQMLRRHVSDTEISAACMLADVGVFPFRRIDNSASVVCALAHDLPVVVCPAGSLVDLQDDYGREWIDNSGSILGRECIETFARLDRSTRPPESSSRGRMAVGAAHHDLYVGLLAEAKQRKRRSVPS